MELSRACENGDFGVVRSYLDDNYKFRNLVDRVWSLQFAHFAC